MRGRRVTAESRLAVPGGSANNPGAMGGFTRWLGLVTFSCALWGCGGSEFSSNGETGGTDAGSGGSGAGGGSGGSATGGGAGSGAAGSGGAVDAGADVAPNNCTSELYQKNCQDPLVTTGDATCDQCGRTNCCNQTNTCLQNETCAQQLHCYLENCLGQSAFACVPAECSQCLGATGIFIGVSSCLQTNCTPVCPMLIP